MKMARVANRAARAIRNSANSWDEMVQKMTKNIKKSTRT